MERKLDLETRRLLAHYRARPPGTSLDVIAKGARAAGRTLIRLRDLAPVPARRAA
jgi:hypothetical protein